MKSNVSGRIYISYTYIHMNEGHEEGELLWERRGHDNKNVNKVIRMIPPT